jgi:type VI secretion system protein VasG
MPVATATMTPSYTDSHAALIKRLNRFCYTALEEAIKTARAQTNPEVEIEHWLLKLFEGNGGDLPPVLRQYDVNPSRVQRELTGALEKLKRGSGRQETVFASDLIDLMREGWVRASLNYGAYKIRSGHLLAALLTDPKLSRWLRATVPELYGLPTDRVLRELVAVTAGSAEADEAAADGGPPAAAAAAGGQASRPGSKTPALDQFTMNLTERAKKGEIDPVVGRDFEIRQVIDILTRRRQNNPILTGEAGVGKTAVVEGFALRVTTGDVPDALKNVEVRTLDLGLLQAGAGVKGEFENRLKNVIAEVKASPRPVILFIDEAHTIIGAGGAAGQGDAANLLKPALARGELRTIAATTWAEYKKYFEEDAALKRRFQVVKVDEPDVDKAVRMLRGFTPTLEKHHKVAILDEGIEDAVKLSHRYITDRQLPDKAVSLLDTTCARVALSQSATPPALEDCLREVEQLTLEIDRLQSEQAAGGAHEARLHELIEKRQKAEEKQADLEKRLEEERKLATELLKVRARLQAAAAADGKNGDHHRHGERPATAEEVAATKELRRLTEQLAKLQGETPLVLPVVDRQAVATVVSGWTGIPVGKMVLDEIKTVLSLRDRLEERVIGQRFAIDAISERMKTARASLTDPRRPIGVFLLVGPSGVGKTETALALADILYGGSRNLVVVNMSEYKEEHKISRLTGSAPGYVGFGQGGVLTEAVRRKPYSIVLLDEVEKANPAVQEIFYQVFDKGTLQDDRGTEVDFKNTIILLTSNAGTDTIMRVCADPDTKPDAKALGEALRPELLKVFKPALLGRLTVAPYFPLADEVIRGIIKLQLKRIGERLHANHRAEFHTDDAVVGAIAGRCKEVESGARNVDSIITGTLLPSISQEFLSRLAEGQTIQRVSVGVDAAGEFTYKFE